MPAPQVIVLCEQAIVDPEQVRGVEARPRTYPWARPSNYAWAMGAVALGLGLHFYYVREMLASLVLFSVFYFSLSLVILSVLGICYAGNRAAIWAGPHTQAFIALFMQQDLGGVELASIPIVEDGRRPTHRREVRRQIERQP